MEMDPTTKVVLEQAFVEMHRRATHAAQRFADGSDNVAEQTRLLFLEEKFKVGQREALANQRLDTSKIAQEILQARQAKDQPQANPS